LKLRVFSVVFGNFTAHLSAMASKKSKNPPASPTPAADGAPGQGPGEEAGDDYDMPVIIKVKPEDQLQLSPEELEKEVPPRVLYPQNPRAATNLCQYSYKEKCFKRVDQVEQFVEHLKVDGTILLKDSAEALEQAEILDRKQEEQNKRDIADAVDVEIEEYVGEEPVKNTLRNQFNFSERASQTFNQVVRERAWTTEPPATTQFRDTVSQWVIFDRYMHDIEKAKEKDAKANAKQKDGHEGDKEETKKKKSESDPLYSENMKLSIKIMERMVNQNAENDVYHDFKYWEDKSDEFRDGDGTLLPLWRFSSEQAKRKQVTALK